MPKRVAKTKADVSRARAAAIAETLEKNKKFLWFLSYKYRNIFPSVEDGFQEMSLWVVEKLQKADGKYDDDVEVRFAIRRCIQNTMQSLFGAKKKLVEAPVSEVVSENDDDADLDTEADLATDAELLKAMAYVPKFQLTYEHQYERECGFSLADNQQSVYEDLILAMAFVPEKKAKIFEEVISLFFSGEAIESIAKITGVPAKTCMYMKQYFESVSGYRCSSSWTGPQALHRLKVLAFSDNVRSGFDLDAYASPKGLMGVFDGVNM